MEPEIQVNVRGLVNDIRAGTGCLQLMEKYGLSLLGLVQALGRLLQTKAMESQELHSLLPVQKQKVVLFEQRQRTRHFVHDRILACDTTDPTIEGTILNITEESLQVQGIPARKGESKDFLIVPEDIPALRSFVVEAECQWVKSESDHAKISGYRINYLSDDARVDLHRLITAISLKETSSYWPTVALEVEETTTDSWGNVDSCERVEQESILSANVTDSGSFNIKAGFESFESLMNALPFPCLLIDKTYRIFFANEFSQTLKANRDQIVAADFLTFFPSGTQRIRSSIDQALLTRTVLTVVSSMKTDTEQQYVRLYLRSVRYGKQRLLFVMIHDLTGIMKKIQSTESRADELLTAYREVLSNLANNEVKEQQRNDVVRLVIDSLGNRLNEEREQLTREMLSHLKPMINRLRMERMSDRGTALLNALENLLEHFASVLQLRAPRAYSILTARETEVCDLILAGQSSKAMAETLGLSLETVATHRNNIRKKLRLRPGQSIFNALRNGSKAPSCRDRVGPETG
jgi:DNA-binding CsgD family transcriptional regulator